MSEKFRNRFWVLIVVRFAIVPTFTAWNGLYRKMMLMIDEWWQKKRRGKTMIAIRDGWEDQLRLWSSSSWEKWLRWGGCGDRPFGGCWESLRERESERRIAEGGRSLGSFRKLRPPPIELISIRTPPDRSSDSHFTLLNCLLNGVTVIIRNQVEKIISTMKMIESEGSERPIMVTNRPVRQAQVPLCTATSPCPPTHQLGRKRFAAHHSRSICDIERRSAIREVRHPPPFATWLSSSPYVRTVDRANNAAQSRSTNCSVQYSNLAIVLDAFWNGLNSQANQSSPQARGKKEKER